jgi:hypothetical protein
MKLKLKLVGALCAIGVMQSASALTVVGNSITNLATEFLSNATITLNPIGFNSTNQGVVAGNALSIRVTLSAGTFGYCGNFYQMDSTNNANQINGTGASGMAPGAPAVPPALTPDAWAATGVGTSTCTYSQTTPNVIVNTTASNTFFRLSGAQASGFGNLVTSGTNDNGCGFTTGSVTLNAKYYDASGVNVDIETRANPNVPGANLDTATIITAAQAITGAWTAAGDTTVDVRNTSPAGSKFVVSATNTGTVTHIGSVRFSNTAGTQADNTGTTDYTVTAALNGTITVGLSAAGGAIPAGTVFGLLAAPDTCVATGVGVPASSTSTVGGLYTAVWNPGVVASLSSTTGTHSLCMRIPDAQASAVPQLAFSGYASVARSSTVTADFANGPTCLATLGKLVYNAGLIEVRNYVPTSAKGFGWDSALRIINSGATATDIRAYFISPAGVVGSTSLLAWQLAVRLT